MCLQPKIKHLGHVIDSNGFRLSLRNSRAIFKVPTPTDVISLESKICSAQYYMQFIKGFSTIIGPKTELRKTKRKVWVDIKATSNVQNIIEWDYKWITPRGLQRPVTTGAINKRPAYGLGAMLFYVVDNI